MRQRHCESLASPARGAVIPARPTGSSADGLQRGVDDRRSRATSTASVDGPAAEIDFVGALGLSAGLSVSLMGAACVGAAPLTATNIAMKRQAIDAARSTILSL